MDEQDNPYESPRHADESPAPSRASGVSPGSVVFVIASTVVCGLGGAAIGAALGVFLPDYYRSVFSGGDSPHFNPVAVGIGQGLTQGLAAGLLGGIGLVAVHYWYRLRSAAQRPGKHD